MGFSKLIYILFLLRHKGGRKKEKTEEVDKKIGVERCKKVQKERKTTKEGDKGEVAKRYKKAGREKKREAKVDKVVDVERYKKVQKERETTKEGDKAVSYKQLTLPTKSIV